MSSKIPLSLSSKWLISRSFARGFCQKIALLPIGGGTTKALSHVPYQNLTWLGVPQHILLLQL